MSRVGRQLIALPQGVSVSLENGTLTVKGPKGTLARAFPSSVSFTITAEKVSLAGEGPVWGTSASHVKSMVRGVSEGFEKRLQIEGVGFRAEVSGTHLTLALGFSHPVKVEIPKDLKVTVEKNMMTVSGVDAERVGQFCASLVALKKPEPYKGKGIRYEGQVVKLKQGKRATATA